MICPRVLSRGLWVEFVHSLKGMRLTPVNGGEALKVVARLPWPLFSPTPMDYAHCAVFGDLTPFSAGPLGGSPASIWSLLFSSRTKERQKPPTWSFFGGLWLPSLSVKVHCPILSVCCWVFTAT